MTTVERARERIALWRKSVKQFVLDNFLTNPDDKLDAWQDEGLDAAVNGDRRRLRLCLKACTGPGKSAVLAWLGWWRLGCFAAPGEHPKGAALSITADNLRDNLWAELAKWQQRSAFLREAFTWTKERVYCNDHPETWFLSFRSFAKDADAEAIGRALSGLHSKFPFLLLDETGDMPIAVGRAAEQIFTGNPIDAGIYQAGNPTSIDGLLYQSCTHLRSQWHVITITADPDDPKRTSRVDVELAREQIRLYGRDNPWVKATILGEFPEAGFNSLLSLADVEAAMNRHLKAPDYAYAQKRIGVDVARFGDDRTVLFPRQGLVAHKPVVMRNADSQKVAARVAMGKAKFGSELELVDDTGGYGAGVIDALNVAGHTPVGINFSSKAMDDRYYNIRAEMAFRMAEWVKHGGALPHDPELLRELVALTYTFHKGRFMLEEKEQMKKRLGFSPDKADALMLTFALPDMPKSAAAMLAEHGILVDGPGSKDVKDWDPYDENRL